MSKIAIIISTRNREKIFKKSYKEWVKHLPRNAFVMVVDDASDKPYHPADHRFTHNVGIAKTKNKCIELAYNSGAEHIFLADDDVYPVVKDWHKPYINSGKNHLCMIFSHFADGSSNGNKLLKQENGISYYLNPTGMLLYFRRKVFDKVGGMDTAYGMWGYEHVDFSQRIFNVGLTDHPFMDVTDSHKLFYSYDHHRAVNRSVPVDVRVNQINVNKKRFKMSKDSKEYIPFQEGENVIITTYFTKQIDTQRGQKWEPNFADVSILAESCAKNNQKLIVLHDELDDTIDVPETTQLIQVETSDNPYFQRWKSIYDHLKENHYNNVFCVDATDVVLLRKPWEEMVSGKMYCGYESGTVNNTWMYKYHNVGVCRQLFTTYRNYPLLNAGILGGDNRIVLGFLENFLWVYNRFKEVGLTDMGLFNLIMHAQFRGVAESGAHVVSKFKQYEEFSKEQIKSGETPWFKHK